MKKLKHLKAYESFKSGISDIFISDLLIDFIDWAKECGEDAWYIFEQTEEAINKFFDESGQKSNWYDDIINFIDWARYCGEDAWYIFEQTEEAINKFMRTN